VKRYLVSRPAERDLEDIKAYLAEEAGARVAGKVIRELRVAIRFLGSNPGAGHLREDLADQVLRFWPVYSYLVIYDPGTRPVEIVRVLHGSRDLTILL
jgi:toxin ParE1/3/4